MKPSELTKRYGLKLNDVARLSGVSRGQLIRWCQDKPRLFHMIVVGCAASDMFGAIAVNNLELTFRIEDALGGQ